MSTTASRFDCWLLHVLRKILGPAPLDFVMDSGGTDRSPLVHPVATICFADRKTLLSVLANPEMGFGDGFTEGKIVVDGDLLAALEAIYDARRGTKPGLLARWLLWTQHNTLRGSRKHVHHHYDLGNDFYRRWLDAEMQYTCAYFPEENTTLEAAQIAKMDHVCRKIWLQPGEKVVEAGCGWGGLALHMARNYGVNVKAYNISHEQIAFARERAKREGLSNQVEFVEDDYRNIRGRFDAFLSVGMLEHVGTEHYKQLGKIIQRAIGDSGRGLLHFIGRNYDRPLSVWIKRRIFPGGHPPALRSVMDIFEPQDYSVLDVENLRMHYARTLEHWLERFENSLDAVETEYSEQFARMWRLYLAGSIAGFRKGTMQLFQVVFAGRECKTIPWNRAYLYEGSERQSDEPWIRAIS
ncbi:MAG TPA: cyclopropane-fatty-acyl-phospholipid synthase family protein [Terriglobales bacterium]|nr:cyclopropane-fatty-acyl-phospholipid synthase family protein [Terriglobales bacterium]